MAVREKLCQGRKGISMTPRQNLLVMLTIPYVHEARRIEDVLALIRTGPTEEDQISLLKDVLAFYGLPIVNDRPAAPDEPRMTPQGSQFAHGVIQVMVEANEIDCCTAFASGDADEAARAVYDQLNLVDRRVGGADGIGAVLWLGFILQGSKHVPFTNIVHAFPPYQKDGAVRAIVANPELYAELSMVLRTGNLLDVARWLIEVPCGTMAREGLVYFALSWITAIMDQSDAVEVMIPIDLMNALQQASPQAMPSTDPRSFN